MMVADNEDFALVVKCLLSTDNDERIRAEETYNNIAVCKKVSLLLNSIVNTALGEGERQMACVLLRRLIMHNFNDFFPQLSAEDQRQLKEQLLLLLRSERDQSLRKKIWDIVAELVRNLVDDDGNNSWPEFLNFLFYAAGAEPALKECALYIFCSVPDIFGKDEENYLPAIKQMLQQSLVDNADLNVRVQAVRALCSFIILHEKDINVQDYLKDLLPSVIKVIQECVYTESAEPVLKSFVDLCESCPKFVKSQLSNVMHLCMKASSKDNIDDSVRHLCLEVIVTLCEVAAPMMRKESHSYMSELTQQLLQMMTELDDDTEYWSTTDMATDDDAENSSVIAESSLDRIACGLGGKVVLSYVTKIIPSMLRDSDWKKRHAALMAISATGEGCRKQMMPLLGEIVNGGVLPFLHDQHPRVRYAACNAIGQLSSDFAPVLQKQHHSKIIPTLLSLMDDNLNPKVQSHAAAALVNFSEDCPKYILVKYLNGIMEKLGQVLSSRFEHILEPSSKMVLEQVVTTIASVADTAEEQFMCYYDKLMPYLKHIINGADSAELKLLKGKTLECVSLIGLAVGREKFINDAKEVMDVLLRGDTSTDITTDEDSYNTYLISAWARICTVLGKQFQPYLPLVIERVMKTAAIKPEVALLDNDSVEELEDDSSWQFVSLGEQQNFGIKTAGLEDKVAACEMLVCYARELKDGFAEYAEEVVRLMVPLLKFYFHDGVRIAASQSLPHLLECVKIKGPEFVKDMWMFVCPELLAAISSDSENEVIGEMYSSLGQCIEILGKGCMTVEWMNSLVTIMDKTLQEHFVEQETELKKQSEEEVIDTSTVDIAEENLSKVSRLSDIMHYLFRTYREDFFPYFDKLLPYYIKMLEPCQHWTNHQWAICIFDDIIEYTGPACKRYESYFLGPLLNFLSHPRPEVRQACCYGVGILAMYGGPSYSNTCAEVVPKLFEVIEDGLAKSEENEVATENAVSALAKIFKYNNSELKMVDVLRWFHGLPVLEDDEEVPHVYGYLCDLVEQNNPVLLGPNNVNLPKIINVMLQVFAREAVKKDAIVAKRMISIICQTQKSPELFQHCLAEQSKELQLILYNILNSEFGSV